jgi:hypothetical protein
MKIKVTRKSSYDVWYNDRVGEEFEVLKTLCDRYWVRAEPSSEYLREAGAKGYSFNGQPLYVSFEHSEKVETIQDTYLKMQEQWVEDNDVKGGTVVKVLRKANDNELGWRNSWTESMSGNIGKELAVQYVSGGGGIAAAQIGERNRLYPFFVLEVIQPPKEPTIEEKYEALKELIGEVEADYVGIYRRPSLANLFAEVK